jgi:hypothetical protein
MQVARTRPLPPVSPNNWTRPSHQIRYNRTMTDGHAGILSHWAGFGKWLEMDRKTKALW